MTVDVLSSRCGEAPPDPGVYFMLGADTELLYVGKATNLRKRLLQHARTAHTVAELRLKLLYDRTAEVRWELLSDEPAAAAREADVIIALRPRFNASHVDQGRWNYITTEPVERTSERVRFALTSTPVSLTRAYGCFPHLGHGVSSRPAVACSDGYTALLRLLWIASARGTIGIPSSVSKGRVPDVFEVGVQESWRPPLHALLSGTGDRVLPELSRVPIPDAPHVRPGLARDVAAAESFFQYGPAAIRRLRLRNGVRSRTIDRARIEGLIAADLEASIGPFRAPRIADPATRHLGRRAHPWAT
jgi:hypothetical protein